MKEFTYYAPTEVVFGPDTENRTGELVRKWGGSKVLVVYGGGSCVRSGLLDRVTGSLKENGIPFESLGGVVPNPRLSLVRRGIDLARGEGIDFIVAVGGGSVIDSAKAIAAGVEYEGDVWDFFLRKLVPVKALPVGAVLTIPAAGSEMSDGCVVTREDECGDEKKSFSNNICRPRFAVMNPELTYTLPAYQTSCGVVDIMMHTLERYFTRGGDMYLTDALADALLRTVMKCGEEVMSAPDDYSVRASIMWASSLAHNDLTGLRGQGDWAVHGLEHEVSGLFDVAHGAGLAAIWGAWARYVVDLCPERFARLAVSLFDIPANLDSKEEMMLTANAGIEAMLDFFRLIGMPVNLTELIGREPSDEEIRHMAEMCTKGGTATLGALRKLTIEDVETIYRNAR